jgi:DNA invertase Pin-like site-specific DNA recombinase
LADNIDTETNSGKLYFHIVGAMAEFERGLLKERVKAGLDAARIEGRIGGRKTVITPEKNEKILELLKSRKTVSEISAITNVSWRTIYRYYPDAKGRRERYGDYAKVKKMQICRQYD